jgi:hypothetical protein
LRAENSDASGGSFSGKMKTRDHPAVRSNLGLTRRAKQQGFTLHTAQLSSLPRRTWIAN